MKTKNILIVLGIVVVISLFTYFTIFGLTINGKAYIKSMKDIKTGLDISGGVSITYQAVSEEKEITADDLNKSKTVIRKRLENMNIFDAYTRVDVNTKQVYVEIPARVDEERDPLEAVKGLDKTAKIEFRDPDGNVLLAGDDIKAAKYSEDPTDQTGIPSPHVVLEFSDEGRTKFAEATGKLAGKTLSVVLDDKVITSPTVNEKIDSNTAIITMGAGTYGEKKNLATEYAMLIDSGALPFTLSVVNKEYVGPYIGQNALDISILAGIVSIIVISLFMMCIYRLPGLVSAICLVCYVALVLFTFIITGTTLTLSGIAGIILSIGMAVDANIIIYERLKEELKQKKSYKKAHEKGFKNAAAPIIDGNVTTFLIALILYVFGIGPIKGFGLVLALGVFITLFTTLVLSKYILKQLIPLISKKPSLFFKSKEVE